MLSQKKNSTNARPPAMHEGRACKRSSHEKREKGSGKKVASDFYRNVQKKKRVHRKAEECSQRTERESFKTVKDPCLSMMKRLLIPASRRKTGFRRSDQIRSTGTWWGRGRGRMVLEASKTRPSKEFKKKEQE